MFEKENKSEEMKHENNSLQEVLEIKETKSGGGIPYLHPNTPMPYQHGSRSCTAKQSKRRTKSKLAKQSRKRNKK
jgi:hypothetical protein